MEIIAFTESYIDKTKLFADQFIGQDYFSRDDLIQSIERSKKAGLNSSLLIVNEKDEVMGMRLSYPNGQWLDLKKPSEISPEKWEVSEEDVAYFQSMFLSDQIQGQGWGQNISLQSMAILKEMGAKAVVCHSWKESPHNSSMKYLEKLGFKAVKEHRNFWSEVDYICVRCGNACVCTATEMVFYL